MLALRVMLPEARTPRPRRSVLVRSWPGCISFMPNRSAFIARCRHLAQFLGVTTDVKQFEGDEGNLNQSSRLACVVNRYGPSDFTKSYGKSVDAAEVLPLWLGGDLEHALPAHIRSSPLNWVTPDAAPTLTRFGRRRSDDTVPAFTINGSRFAYGDFLNAALTFLIVAAVMFFLVIKPVNILMARMSTEDDVESPTRPCPECLSQIPREASRCAFCTTEVPAAA